MKTFLIKHMEVPILWERMSSPVPRHLQLVDTVSPQLKISYYVTYKNGNPFPYRSRNIIVIDILLLF